MSQDVLKTLVSQKQDDFHKLIFTFFKTLITLLKQKIVYYRNYKHFEDSIFLEDLISTDFSLNRDGPNENYSFVTGKFLHIINRPLKNR